MHLDENLEQTSKRVDQLLTDLPILRLEASGRHRRSRVRGACPLLEVAKALLHGVGELRERLLKLGLDLLELGLDEGELHCELIVPRERLG